MSSFAVRDELLDAQTLRAAGVAPYGGADVGECLATARRVQGTDLDSWHREWTATAERLLELGEREAGAGRNESARSAFFRSSTYFRTAGVMLMGTPLDPRLVESNTRQTEAFRRGAALLPTPAEQVRIPFEDTTLPGWFFRVDASPEPRPTVVLIGGYDGTAEELYFLNGAAALARGYQVLAFDGPGQGSALLQHGLVLRPDWENVLPPVLDHLLAQDGVDGRRVAVIGLSLGAHLAPRAVSGEHRPAACIADCGSFDLFADALTRMPPPLAAGFRAERALPTAAVGRILSVLERKPTAGWALRRGQLVHGSAGPLDYLRDLRTYSLAGRAGAITCPMFVCNAEDDDIGRSAPRLVEAVPGDVEFVTFAAADGAGDHCEAGARTLFHARAFGWLDHILAAHSR